MEDTQIKAKENEDIYFSFLGQPGEKDIKLIANYFGQLSNK